MDKILLISVFQLLLLTTVNGQDTEEYTNCFDRFEYCLKTKMTNGINNVSLVDTSGNILLDRDFTYLSFSSEKNYFKIKSQNGFGIINIKGDTIVEPKYKNATIIGSTILVKTASKKFLAYNTDKELIVKEEQDLIIPKKNDLLWVKKDELWQLYSNEGKLVVPTQLVEYQHFTVLPEVADIAWKAKSIGNKYYLILVIGKDVQYDIYHDIYQPPRNFNCKVFSELPNEQGEVLKFATFEYGKKRTPSKYIEICFNPECLEKFKSVISIDKIPKKTSTDAIGILPNHDIELIDSDPDLQYQKISNLK